ncbi:MAG TPA: hypothetical protein VN442_11495 [Bryobacteraceae bacterium]|nr:hypothetical protein [Bryobacteraceae bacterium]
MSCREFETIVTDLGRSRPLDAVLRAGAEAHAAACSRCRARLEAERLLSGALEALAAAGPRQAPDRVEQALRGVFVARKQARRRGMAAWAVGAAAASALIAALWIGRPAPEKASIPLPDRPIAAPPPEVKVAVASAPAATRSVRPRRPRIALLPRAVERETQFIPLSWVAEPAAPEDLYIARMRVSRATLVAAGLPMNMERADEAVQAEVVFTVDGTARAIRILR